MSSDTFSEVNMVKNASVTGALPQTPVVDLTALARSHSWTKREGRDEKWRVGMVEKWGRAGKGRGHVYSPTFRLLESPVFKWPSLTSSQQILKKLMILGTS